MRKLKVEFYVDKAGEHRWRLVASNGRIKGDSGEGYKRKSGARKAMDAIHYAFVHGLVDRAPVEPAARFIKVEKKGRKK